MMLERGGNVLLAVAVGRQRTGHPGDSHTRNPTDRAVKHGSIVIDGFQNIH
jgi:hypothetical protein